ncbi:S-adenosyl-L-methionine-dependent methyltransferase [Cokeromyces recurvatus]|uniref:S-adenosyl-L-methionine-dependent methyltransferase n=1 Tax=Cokeromyces recurvatus TaxID=90255 RepID=UPI00221F2291|nr:S-adenosyl-L-methionine-dependent methyltransferase [Cokeromyces recurvatus]KAI7905583.1 S-adenosyl-L-methionine-dependent methyltransferase [Cokeromyces recurvatus]
MAYNHYFVIGYICILFPIIYYTTDYLKSILLYLHAIGAAYGVLFIIHFSQDNKGGEMYGVLQPILSNINMVPKTLWFNMGLWNKPNLSFPEACENLVNEVTTKLNIQPYSTILDIGFGCGDSCIFLAEKYKASVVGITNEESQWKVATDRVREMKFTNNQQIRLFHGSADDLNTLLLPSQRYDYVISIDSAYHFNTRWDFLKNVYGKLDDKKEGSGMIGIYDLTVNPLFLKNASYLQRYIFQLIAKLVHIPIQNLITANVYQQQMIELGYKDVEIQTIDRQLVFGGLSEHFRQQYNQATKYGATISLFAMIYLKFSIIIFNLLARKSWLVPVIIKGKK